MGSRSCLPRYSDPSERRPDARVSTMASFLSRLLGIGASEPPLLLRNIPVELVNSRPDIADADVLERLDEALGLIERHQPIRFRHLVRDIRAIRVERYACRGAFIPSERTVITELTFLARRDITAAPVASSILHEGVHARVEAFATRVLGGRGGAWSMAREERLCRRAELTFGRSLPGDLGAPVVERAIATLDMEDQDVAPVVDWRLAQERIRAADRATD